RFGGYAAGLGVPLSPGRLRSAGAPTAAGPRTVAHHHAATRRSDRTPQTRKSPSHRHHAVARTGSIVRSKRTGDICLHAVSFPQTARSLGKATARALRAQEVRSR